MSGTPDSDRVADIAGGPVRAISVDFGVSATCPLGGKP